MDVERALVSKMAQTGGAEKMLRRGVDGQHFVDPQCKDVFEYCAEHTRKYAASPSFETVRKKFSTFNFEVSSDALDFLGDEFIKLTKRREGIKALRELSDIVDDPDAADDVDARFLEAARRLAQIVPSDRAMRMSDQPSRIELWKQQRATGVMPGIPMGIPAFDEYTLGVQKHEFLSIVGWQGTGKSTLLQYVFFHGYLRGSTSLMISLEMQAEALFRKWDIMAINAEKDIDEAIKYHDMKKFKLTDKQLRSLETMAKRVATAKNDIIVLDGIGRCTVDKIYAETIRYQPDMVGVDYMSLMDTPRGTSNSMWEKVTYLTGNLKLLARTLGVPMYGIAQTNIDSASDGAALSNIAYSRSIGQDCDLIFGLKQDDQMKENKQMVVRMLKNRDGATTEAELFWDMSTMRFRTWLASDQFPLQSLSPSPSGIPKAGTP